MQIEEYRAFMERYVEFMEELSESSSEKYAALISYDAKKADHAVSQQQAMNMRLTQLEAQREAEQKKVGFDGLTFHQIIERLDGEQQEQFRKLFRRLESAINNTKYFNGKSMAFAQEGLHMLGAVATAGQAGTYGANGKRPDGVSGIGLFEKKI